MSSVNKVFIIGHLGADPEGFITRSTKQGAKFLAPHGKRA